MGFLLKRSIQNVIQKDISKKIILMSGPRQCGKTTLSKMIGGKYEYLSYDLEEDRNIIQNKAWSRDVDYVIFDELHKKDKWKLWLKGIYDTEEAPNILVTGSARMDIYRKMGDSLAGRFFYFRLHPLDLKEICRHKKDEDPEKVLENLLELGGFPEPYLEGKKSFYNKWKRTHFNTILREDLITFETTKNIHKIELLVDLLKKCVGSPVSYQSLSRHLDCSHNSVAQWIQWLENLFVVFRVPPYHKHISKALKKKSKFYFYDTGVIANDKGKRLENLTACSLLKENHFREDCYGKEHGLYFIQEKNKKEMDFLITEDETPVSMVEVKYKNDSLSTSFDLFESQLKKSLQKIQVDERA